MNAPLPPEPVNFCAPDDTDKPAGELFDWADAVFFLAAAALITIGLLAVGCLVWLR